MTIFAVPQADWEAVNVETEGNWGAWVEDGHYVDGEHDYEGFDIDEAVVNAGVGTSLSSWLAAEGVPSVFEIGFWLPTVDERLHQPPTGLDWHTGLASRLHPVVTMVKGEVTKIIYYGEETYTTPVVEESFAYVRSVADLAVKRTQTIKWYMTDGSVDPDSERHKVQTKLYDTPGAQISEGHRRRHNIIDFVFQGVIGHLDLTRPADAGVINTDRSYSLWEVHAADVSLYIDAKVTDLSTAIADDTTHTWLDDDIGGSMTIRDWILQEIDLS